MKSSGTQEDDHREYSFVANSPWAVAHYYKQAFGKEFLGPVVIVPGNKHYSWQKGVSLLGFGDSSFWTIELDEKGNLCVADLKRKIELAKKQNRPILMVVSVAGTTELGEIDPVDKVQDLLDEYERKEKIHIWHHVDAAYGGFYCSLLGEKKTEELLSPKCISALKSIRRANSLTIDPHKLGYIPYACGAVLLKNKTCNRVSSFSAPYLSKLPSEDAWSSTLEGSRSASGARRHMVNG